MPSPSQTAHQSSLDQNSCQPDALLTGVVSIVLALIAAVSLVVVSENKGMILTYKISRLLNLYEVNGSLIGNKAFASASTNADSCSTIRSTTDFRHGCVLINDLSLPIDFFS